MQRVSRRRFLAGLGGALAATAGCQAGGTRPTEVLVAGSLQQAATNSLPEHATQPLAIEAFGSVHAARLVSEGRRDPDVVTLADPALFETVLSAPWHAVIATNELVIAHRPASSGGRTVAEAEYWPAALAAPDVALGRTDPTLDPLGYRTLFALELAAMHYDDPSLVDRVVADDQVYPETQLLAQFETGSIDAAVVYRTMAVERDYPYRELPPAVNLGDPSFAASYAKTRYRLPDGTLARGAPIEYAATRRRDDDATAAVFESVLDGQWLAPHGFRTPAKYPSLRGDVPDALA